MSASVAVACGDTDVSELVLTTGGKGGTYLPLGQGIGAAADGAVRVSVIESAGALENMSRLEAGQAQLAFVQNDTPGGAAIRTVAPLYKEVLHLLRHRDAAIASLSDLRGKRVAVGAERSGTRALVKALLAHFGMTLSDIDAAPHGSSKAVDELVAGNIDAVFILSGLRSASAQRAIDSGNVAFVSLGDATTVGNAMDGFRYSYPFAEPFIIPEQTYTSFGPAGGLPEDPVATIAVQAILVTRADTPPDTVAALTRAVFESRVELVRAHPSAAEISERFDASVLQFPVHDGADSYYRREEPGFLARNAETMAFILSAFIALIAVFTAASKWLARNKKNRVDVYYAGLDQIFTRLEADLNESEVLALRDELVAMRRRAFRELIDERLRADESFRIFQDFWAECFERTSQLLANEPAAGSGG